MTEFSKLRQKAGISLGDLSEKSGYAERHLRRWENGELKPRKAVMDLLQGLYASAGQQTPAGTRGFTFIDLFAGIGGLRLGFESIGGRCIFTSEYNRFCQDSYRANFPTDEHDIHGDITKIEARDIPAHDVLLAGFPCQPFSLAGVSKKNSLNRPHGFQCEIQGTLFFDVARIIREHRPKAILLENVKNLLSHDGGRTFDVIKRTLEDDLGYHISPKVIDARHWVPQHRERIFIAGFRKDLKFGSLPNFDMTFFETPNAVTPPKLKSILHPEDGTETADEKYTFGRKAIVHERYTLSDKLWSYLEAYAEKHRLKGNGFGCSVFGPDDVARTLSARYHKDGSEILIRQKGRNPRRLTPRECARLMGYEVLGGPAYKFVVSDTQAYRQFGNSVVVPVVTAIAKYMSPWIDEMMKPATAVKAVRQAREKVFA